MAGKGRATGTNEERKQCNAVPIGKLLSGLKYNASLLLTHHSKDTLLFFLQDFLDFLCETC